MAAAIPAGSIKEDDHHSTTDSLQGKSDGAVEPPIEGECEYATGFRLFLLMFTISMSGLLTALEIGIIATAIPDITNEFDALSDVGWYGCATFLAVAASSAVWGKLFKYLSVKYVYLASIAIFLVGSIVSAAAPNSESVTIGRAIQGLGISGTMSGSIIVINYVSHPKLHPLLIGIWTGIFMVSTILGPVIGGALTSEVSWRWCFWINLPLGAPIVILLLLFLRVPKHIEPVPATWNEIVLQLDLPAFTLVLCSLICLTFALQWGGQAKSWSDGSVIATLVLWILCSIAFVVVEWFQGPRAMVPLRLLKPRQTWANGLYLFISSAAFFQIMFYLPLYFQSIHAQSAVTSGVNTLAFLAFFAVGAVTSGSAIGKTRLLVPYQLASALLMTAGMALLYRMDMDTSQAWYIGAQVLFGFGVGLGNQVPMTAVQGMAKPEDVSSSTAIMFMFQSGSGAYSIVVAQSIFANSMLKSIGEIAPQLNPLQVLGTGASEIRHVFRGSDLTAVLDAYLIGLKDVFAFALAASACAVLLSLVIPFKKLPEHDGKKLEVEGLNIGESMGEGDEKGVTAV